MSATYTLTEVKSTIRGTASAILCEDGVQIAKVSRKANCGIAGVRFCQSVKASFFSSQSAMRFGSFCGSISCEETLYALGFPQPFAN